MRVPSPTPSEYTVLIVFGSTAFVVLGLVAIVFAFRAGPEKAVLAASAMKGGLVSVAIGITMAVSRWLYCRNH